MTEDALFPEKREKPSKVRRILVRGVIFLLLMALAAGTAFVLHMKNKICRFSTANGSCKCCFNAS